VLIPAANVQNLMLRDEVVAAVAAGRFSIRPIESVEDALACLTGLPVGEPDGDGTYPPGSAYGRITTRLAELAELAQTVTEDHTHVRG
jgi:predicted ATP-dependent protease